MNSDLQKAVEILNSKNCTMVAVKNNEIIEISHERGIKPLYLLYKNKKNELEGISIADKVIGKGAALIVKNAKIKALHTKLISQPAFDILKDIELYADKIVPNIINRKKTDLCPIEKISQTTEDIDVLLLKIEEFLSNQDS